ncbi:MerR family transcriptional regulator [Sphingobacterium pedocola]|uniref:Helix-turn-helix domain-containing protein n=1 Tax=Sphingobacterium pedocola TaxID=2082722 RepID=A0ABR9T3N3_9SPHI|nr:helix-turn-helix domain-containing protein [Sphingobacterium pedocola]MBE8719958.1 hypothetical protein [Sphingobacterium pedocola]
MKNQNERVLQTLRAILKLLEDRVPATIHVPTIKKEGEETSVQIIHEEEGLMTLKEAYVELNISRSTLHTLREEGKLTSVYQGRNVRLLRIEVMAAKKWYSTMKGKL